MAVRLKHFTYYSLIILLHKSLSCEVSLMQVMTEDIRDATVCKMSTVGMVVSWLGISKAISIPNDVLVKM